MCYKIHFIQPRVRIVEVESNDLRYWLMAALKLGLPNTTNELPRQLGTEIVSIHLHVLLHEHKVGGCRTP